MADLIERVQALPAELYNEIRDLTFTMAFGTIHIDAAYKPPALIQVNRSSRKSKLSGIFNCYVDTFSDHCLGSKLAEPYYRSTSIFYVDRDVISKRLQSIDPAYVEMLNEIRLSNKRFCISKDLCLYYLYERIREESNTLSDVNEDGFHRITQDLRFEVVCGDREKTKWVSLSSLTHGVRQRRGPSLHNAREWVEIYGSE